jgi:hypothetical protein
MLQVNFRKTLWVSSNVAGKSSHLPGDGDTTKPRRFRETARELNRPKSGPVLGPNDTKFFFGICLDLTPQEWDRTNKNTWNMMGYTRILYGKYATNNMIWVLPQMMDLPSIYGGNDDN